MRNCQAVAQCAQNYGDKIAVIPAGEKWEDNTLRPALEDLIGAGAILSYLTGSLSPEAETAVAVCNSVKNDYLDVIKKGSSGEELIEKSVASDVVLAA